MPRSPKKEALQIMDLQGFLNILSFGLTIKCFTTNKIGL